MFITRNSLRIVATVLAKNEEDIIAANIEHHLAQGVSRIILTDNGSTDKTKEIASRYKEVEIIDEPGDDHRQSEWVTRMARLACKFDPDWIVHLDADELWCGLNSLRAVKAKAFGSTKMFLHPPVGGPFDLFGMSKYLDFEAVPNLPGECKVGHRPDPEIVVTHGNHGFMNCSDVEYTKDVWRHHYPVRSLEQFRKKTVDGHTALKKRNAICERWERWYNLNSRGELGNLYSQICDSWRKYVEGPNLGDLVELLRFWSTSEVLDLFINQCTLPTIGEWPRSSNA